MKANQSPSKAKTADSDKTKLKTQGVNLYYRDFQALRNVTLDIPERAITAVIGPSGCGKSSFLRLFNRMNDLIRGRGWRAVSSLTASLSMRTPSM